MKPKKASAPAAVFDETSAKSCEPRRHSDGRTISFEQGGDAGAVHLFSATGSFIGSKKGKVAAPAAPAVTEPAPSAPTSPATS